MTADREALVAEVAGVLGEHIESAGGLFCSCQPEDMHGRLPLATTWETHLAHVLADLLDARVRQQKAEALREAAEAMFDGPPPGMTAAEMLDYRADRIEADL